MFKTYSKIVLIAFSLLLAANAFAVTLEYDGSVIIDLPQDRFYGGDTVNASILISNSEDFPLANAYLVLEIVKGEYYYPSQKLNSNNVIYEEIVRGINLAPGASKTIPFAFELRNDLDVGIYRIDAYLQEGVTPIAGVPYIFDAPHSAYFVFNGTDGVEPEFPVAKIVRPRTAFNDTTGPVGAPAEPNSMVGANIFVENTSNAKVSGLVLNLVMCEWNDTVCETELWTHKVAIGEIAAEDEAVVELQVPAPAIADAYAVKMELNDSEGNLLSLYRNRIIVAGETKKIRKLYVNDYYFEEGDTVTISAVIGPSPDHYNDSPVLYGAEFKISVIDLETNGPVFEQSLDLTPAEELYLEREVSFQADRELTKFRVCGVIEKAGVEHENYCFDLYSEQFVQGSQSEISVDWSYNIETSSLLLQFCPQDIAGASQLLNARYYLSDSKGNLVAEALAESDACLEQEIKYVKKEKHSLLVLNTINFEQQKTEIDIPAYLKSCINVDCSDNVACTADSCVDGECIHAPLAEGASCGSGMACKSGECRPLTSFEMLTPIFIPLFALIGIALIAFVGYKYYKKRGKE